jgi:hypothetical protein
VYPELVRNLADSMADRGYSLVALGAAAGLPADAANLLPWLVGVPLLAVAPVVARREDGDRRAFSVAIVAALVLTPIVWLHYFALLIVPLALTRPRLAWAWGLLWLLWLTPGHVTNSDLWRIALGTAVMAAALVVVVVTRGQPGGRASHIRLRQGGIRVRSRVCHPSEDFPVPAPGGVGHLGPARTRREPATPPPPGELSVRI